VPADPQALRLLSRAARGSMRDALSLTDQAIAFGSGQLQEATVRQMLGTVDRSHVFRLIDALAHGDGRAVVETSEELRHNGLSAASTLEEMCAVLQRMAVLQAVPDMPVDEGDPEAAEVARLADLMPRDETQLLYSICLHGRTELGLAPDEYAALTMALLRLLAFKPENAETGLAEKKTPVLRSSRPVLPRAASTASAQVASPAVEKPAAPVVIEAPVAEPKQLQETVSNAERAPENIVSQALVAAEITPEPAAPEFVAEPVPEPLTEPVRELTPEPVPAPVAASVATSLEEAQVVEPQPAAVEVMQAADSDEEDADEAESDVVDTADVADATAPDEGAWSGMPDEGWADDGRWGDDVEPDVGLLPVSAPAAQEEEAAEAPNLGAGALQEVAPVERTVDGDLWQGVVQQLLQNDSIVALARQLALQAQLIARDGESWTLRVESSSLNQAGARERLRAALEAAGHARQLQVEQGAVTDSPARRLAVENHARQQIAQDIVKSNSLVQTLMRDFGAKIVPGSIKPISIQPE
jgi:DNA polymerase-3 subunit gamma/tau